MNKITTKKYIWFLLILVSLLSTIPVTAQVVRATVQVDGMI